MSERGQQCGQVKADGGRCRAHARPGRRFCLFHDPQMAQARRAGRKAGGVSRSRPAAVLPAGTPDLPLRTAADVIALLGLTINQVRRGELDVRVANALGFLCTVLLKAVQGGDLAARIEMLEAVLKMRNGSCRR
jgi:hypothetical protein